MFFSLIEMLNSIQDTYVKFSGKIVIGPYLLYTLTFLKKCSNNFLEYGVVCQLPIPNKNSTD